MNYMFAPVTQIQADLNPLMDYIIDFAFVYGESIGRILFPSNSIPF